MRAAAKMGERMRVSLGVVIALSVGGVSALAQSAPPAAPKPAETAATAPPQEEIRSESKFLAALYAEIAKQSATEEEKELGEGETTASFHIDATGKIDKVTIDKTTSEAHAAAVKRILALVKVPRPPGGGMDVGQTFKFH